MKYPTFIIIGAAKSGTTSLYHYLKPHPSVFMSPIKEPWYFAYDAKTAPESMTLRNETIKSLKDYEALFDGVRNETAVGEASAIYLNFSIAAERIRAYNPDVQIITVLRHPVERTFSHYMMLLNSGYIPYQPFGEFFRKRIMNNPEWRKEPEDASGCSISLYHENLTRYYDRFERSRILPLKYDDLTRDSESVCRKIFDFIGVDSSFRVNTGRRHNEGPGLPRSQSLHNLLVGPGFLKSVASKVVSKPMARKIGSQIRVLNSSRAPLDPYDRAEFMQFFRDDVLETQALTGLDLSNWLNS